MSKAWTVSVELTSKELNYLDGALRRSVHEYEQRGDFGNIKQLLWFTKRLKGKLHRINTKAVRAHMTQEQKRAVTRYLRKAFKQMRKSR